MRKIFILMLLGFVIAGTAGMVDAPKIKVGTAEPFPEDT